MRFTLRILMVPLLLLLMVGCFSTLAPRSDADQAGILSTKYLASASNALYNNGGGSVTMEGFSESAVPVDQIWVRITLQRWNGSAWVDIKSVRKDAYNTSIVTASNTETVTRGYLYRVKSEHQVVHKGEQDPNPALVLYSDSKLIN